VQSLGFLKITLKIRALCTLGLINPLILKQGENRPNLSNNELKNVNNSGGSGRDSDKILPKNSTTNQSKSEERNEGINESRNRASDKSTQKSTEKERLRVEPLSLNRERLDWERFERTCSTGNSSSKVDTAKQRDYASDLKILRSTLHVKVQPKLDQLIKGLDEQAEEQVNIFENTYNLLTGSMTVQEYQDFAKTVQGKPSPMLKAIGVLMIALAAAVVAFALVVPTAGLSLVVAGYTAVALAGSGAFSMFAGRQKGVSRDMEELANTHVAQLGN